GPYALAKGVRTPSRMAISSMRIPPVIRYLIRTTSPERPRRVASARRGRFGLVGMSRRFMAIAVYGRGRFAQFAAQYLAEKVLGQLADDFYLTRPFLLA